MPASRRGSWLPNWTTQVLYHLLATANPIPPVPKFGSFKPRATQSPARPGKSTLQKSDLRGEDEKKRRPRSHQEDGERRSKCDEHHRSRQRQSPSGEETSRKRPVPDDSLTREELEESDLFITDRRGDTKNVEYGSLHRYSIPAYHRMGYGRLIGAPGNAKIDREASTEKLIVLSSASGSDRDQPRRLLSSRAGQSLHERRLRLRKQPAAPLEDRDADFLPLRSSTGLERKRNDPSHITAALTPEVDYRSIEGKAKPSQGPLDHDLEDVSDSDEDNVEEMLAGEAREQSTALSRRTKEEPSNVQGWLNLIEHQVHVLMPGKDPAIVSNSEKRALADVRLSIYEKALRTVKRESPDYERLLLGMMEQGRLFWETTKLAEKWQEVLKQHPSSVGLWIRYLDVVQTSALTFRFEDCKATYLRCLQRLASHQGTGLGSHENGTNVPRLTILLRYTCLLRDSGYEELAYSLWQAVLEFHFFRRQDLINLDEAMQSFADFWASDVPRIGEEGACGWSAYQEGEAVHKTRTSAPMIISKLDAARPVASFAAVEAESLGRFHLSTCADDDTAEDPFRFVMNSDIVQVLRSVDGLPKHELIDHFLAFMGLPSVAGAGVSALRADQFVEEAGIVNLTGEPSRVPMQCQSNTTWHLFNGAFDCWRMKHSDQKFVTFLDHILSMLTASCSTWDAMAEYTIAFRLATDQPDVAKYTKQLLKARPTRLRLYNAWALVQASRAGIDKVVEIWSTALKMSSSFDDVELANRVILWHSWMFTVIYREREEDDAPGLILAMVDRDHQVAKQASDRSEVSPAQLLKTKQYLEGSFESMLYQQRYDLAELYAEIHMWLVYLINDHSLQHAIEQREIYSFQLARHSSTVAQELLAQATAGIIVHHIKARRSFKPATLRTKLQAALELYPNNSRIAEAFVLVGSHTKIEDRIRGSLYSDLLTGRHASVVGWSFAFEEELRRFWSDFGSGTENAVRASFKRALLTPDSKVKHSVTLWKGWLEFEVALLARSTDAQRAKSIHQVRLVFLDGLRHLPWIKAWVVWGLGLFAQQGGMSNMELKRVFDVLGERELRVRVQEIDEAMACFGHT